MQNRLKGTSHLGSIEFFQTNSWRFSPEIHKLTTSSSTLNNSHVLDTSRNDRLQSLFTHAVIPSPHRVNVGKRSSALLYVSVQFVGVSLSPTLHRVGLEGSNDVFRFPRPLAFVNSMNSIWAVHHACFISVIRKHVKLQWTTSFSS